MSDTASSRDSRPLTAAWLVFASIGLALMFALPGEETIPYHLIWASFALLYGLIRYSQRFTWLMFSTITVSTGVPMIEHAMDGVIGWEECTEIVLMGILVALLIWHVNRQRAAQDRLEQQMALEDRRNRNRETTAQFGSHELRTRLTIARGFVELIRDGTADRRTIEDAGLVIGELDKASALATKLLTLVQVDSPPQREPMDLDQQIDTIVRRWQATAGRRWRSTSAVGVVLGDEARVEAALDCLIENAVKFTDEDDEIAVQTWREDGVILISVIDSGAGIPAADLGRITEVFQTGSSAGERAGSGIGLAIVRTIAEARGGCLQVSSAEGHGTRFTLRLPTSPSGPEVAPPLAVSPEAAMAAGSSAADRLEQRASVR